MTTATESAAPASAGPGRPAVVRSESDRLRNAVVVAAPALLALGLCLYGLASRSLGFDEGASVAIASRHGSALGHAIAHDGGNMSGYYLILHVLIGWFGDGLWVVRTPSAIATATTVALTGGLALRMFGRRVGLIAGLLAAVSLPLVFWGQSARGYAAMVALTTASFVAFEALIVPDGRRAIWPWIAYVACTALAVYCGFVAVLVLPSQLLLLAVRRSRTAVYRVASAMATAGLCCLPLVVLAAGRGPGQLFWVPRPALKLDGQVLEALASAGLPPSFHTTLTTLPLLALTGAVLAALALRRPPGTGLLFAWLLVPVIVAFAESIAGQPVFLARNLLPVLPAVSILLAVAVADRRLSALAAGTLLAALLVLRVLQLIPSYGVSPEDWRSAARHVVADSRSGDCIAFYPADGHMAFAYYARGGAPAPRSILPATPWSDPPRPFVEDYATLSAARLARLPARCPRLWLVWSHQGQPDGPAGARANLARFARLRAELRTVYPGHPRPVTFGYAATVRVERLSAAGPQGRSVVPTKVR